MRVRTIVSLLAVVITAMAWGTTSSQAAPSGKAVIAPAYGPYEVFSDHSHLCMDVAYGSKVDGARIQQWDCYGGTPEQWRLDLTSIINGVYYYQFVNINSEKCLDVPGGSTNWGVELTQWTCWGGDMQQWALYSAPNNTVTIRNMKSGHCVDVQTPSGAGWALVQWGCNNLPVQRWRLR